MVNLCTPHHNGYLFWGCCKFVTYTALYTSMFSMLWTTKAALESMDCYDAAIFLLIVWLKHFHCKV